MAELPPLITRAQLEARYSPLMVQRVLNDYGEGVASGEAIDQLLADASSKVRGKLGPIVALDELGEDATEARRICLDVAGAYMAQRHPEVVRYDAEKLLKIAERDLDAIRTGKADLGTESPPVLANDGADVTSGNPDDPNYPDPGEHFALDGTGYF